MSSSHMVLYVGARGWEMKIPFRKQETNVSLLVIEIRS